VLEEVGHSKRVLEEVGCHGLVRFPGIWVFVVCTYTRLPLSNDPGVLHTEYDTTNLSFRVYVRMTVPPCELVLVHGERDEFPVNMLHPSAWQMDNTDRLCYPSFGAAIYES